MIKKLLIFQFSVFNDVLELYTVNRQWRLLRSQMYRLMAGFALLMSATFLSITAKAQILKAITLDGGGHTSGFAQADNGRIYAYGDVFGAWRTDDEGETWTYLNWSIPGGDVVGVGMAVQKDNADVVYYATYNSLWKSINGGTSWTKLLDDVNWGGQPKESQRFRGTSQILINSSNPNEIWFAAPRKNQTGWLWKSTNGGVRFDKVDANTFDSNKARTLHHSSAYPDQIWVGSDLGLYVTINGGSNFQQVTNHPNVGMIQRFTTGDDAGTLLITRDAVNGDGGGVSRVFSTTNNYNDFTSYTAQRSNTVSLYFGYPTGLQIFSDNTACAWNTGGDRQGYSIDGGRTFTVRPTTLNTDPDKVPVWTTAEVMDAKDHPDYGTDQVIQVGNDPNKWIITGGGAAMKSLDKGLSWSYFPNGSGIAAVKAYTVGVSKYDVNRLYIPASDIGTAIVTDGGTSGLAQLSSTKTQVYLHGAHRVMEGPNLNDLRLAGVKQGDNKTVILKSSDGGQSWSPTLGNGLPLSSDGVTKSVMSLSNANDFLVVLASGTVMENPPANSINPGVYRTTDGGDSFQQVDDLPSGLSTGNRYDPQSAFIERDATLPDVRYFVARGINFYKSFDGGSNWQTATHPFPNNNGTFGWVWCLAADPIVSNTLWAAGEAYGVSVSRNGGVSWTGTSNFGSKKFFGAKFVSSCDGKVAIWGKLNGEPNPDLLWYSDDDGQTWTAQTTEDNNFHGVQGITVDRTGKIWVSWNSVTVVTPVVGVLPVKLESFSGKATATGNLLSWKTISEQNNNGFEIWRSKNGSEFEKIGFKKSSAVNGNSNTPLNYSFTDAASEGETYYQLNQIDIDGTSTKSSVVVVKGGLLADGFVYPNPIIDNVDIVLNVSKTELATINIIDPVGKVVITKNEKLEKGKNAIKLNISNLAAGWYVLDVKDAAGKSILTKKIIKL